MPKIHVVLQWEVATVRQAIAEIELDECPKLKAMVEAGTIKTFQPGEDTCGSEDLWQDLYETLGGLEHDTISENVLREEVIWDDMELGYSMNVCGVAKLVDGNLVQDEETPPAK